MTRKIIAIVDDLFFASKIRGAAEYAGAHVMFPRTTEALYDAARREPIALIIVDLHTRKIDPFELAVNLKDEEQTRAIPLVGFFSHVQFEMQTAALAAGFDQVMPRSAFVKRLGELLSTDYADYTDKNLNS
jgi:PleD family two-component response regulator